MTLNASLCNIIHVFHLMEDEMPYQNLYRWESGFEPEWVDAARKDHIARIRECQRKARAKAEQIVLDMAVESEKPVSHDELLKIVEASKLGMRVVGKLLSKHGVQYADVRSGYPAAWPKWMRERVRMFVGENIVTGRYGDEWLTVDACVVELGIIEPDTLEYLTTRGMRMAMEVNGLSTIRRADGRGIVGYALRR